MIVFLFFVVIGFFVLYIYKNKIHIKWNSFIHKGFKKTDNKFRARGFHAVSKEPARHIAALLIVSMKNLQMIILF